MAVLEQVRGGPVSVEPPEALELRVPGDDARCLALCRGIARAFVGHAQLHFDHVLFLCSFMYAVPDQEERTHKRDHG